MAEVGKIIDGLDDAIRADVAAAFEITADFRDTLEQGSNPMEWLAPAIETMDKGMLIAFIFSMAFLSQTVDVTTDEIRTIGESFSPVTPAMPFNQL